MKQSRSNRWPLCRRRKLKEHPRCPTVRRSRRECRFYDSAGVRGITTREAKVLRRALDIEHLSIGDGFRGSEDISGRPSSTSIQRHEGLEVRSVRNAYATDKAKVSIQAGGRLNSSTPESDGVRIVDSHCFPFQIERSPAFAENLEKRWIR